jgi:hypothetical protein
VQKGSRVDEFDHSGQGITFLSLITADFRTDQQQKRPEPFSATADKMLDDFRDEINLGAKMDIHAFFHTLQIVGIALKYVLHLHETFTPALITVIII